ncbi:MAG: hypothetical protein NTU49_09340 [Gammaproteobacteria bacterium]|nr:hypothetical protein [Gammaproteobacteria bacterium]
MRRKDQFNYGTFPETDKPASPTLPTNPLEITKQNLLSKGIYTESLFQEISALNRYKFLVINYFLNSHFGSAAGMCDAVMTMMEDRVLYREDLMAFVDDYEKLSDAGKEMLWNLLSKKNIDFFLECHRNFIRRYTPEFEDPSWVQSPALVIAMNEVFDLSDTQIAFLKACYSHVRKEKPENTLDLFLSKPIGYKVASKISRAEACNKFSYTTEDIQALFLRYASETKNLEILKHIETLTLDSSKKELILAVVKNTLCSENTMHVIAQNGFTDIVTLRTIIRKANTFGTLAAITNNHRPEKLKDAGLIDEIVNREALITHANIVKKIGDCINILNAIQGKFLEKKSDQENLPRAHKLCAELAMTNNVLETLIILNRDLNTSTEKKGIYETCLFDCINSIKNTSLGVIKVSVAEKIISANPTRSDEWKIALKNSVNSEKSSSDIRKLLKNYTGFPGTERTIFALDALIGLTSAVSAQTTSSFVEKVVAKFHPAF